MKFIVDNKIYDTEKATLLCTGRKTWAIETFFGIMNQYRDTSLYKTNKGAYFFVYNKGEDLYDIRVIRESVAKDFLMKQGYDNYVEIFGELEEA